MKNCSQARRVWLLFFILELTNGFAFQGSSAHDVKDSLSRTVIFVYYKSTFGEYVFLRGGISPEHRKNCTTDVSTDPCAIGIRTLLLGTIDTYDSYNHWRVGDNFLDWYGAEPDQGLYNGQPALGTSTAWTTNNPYSPAFQELNTYGDNYWMVDMEMDCSRTEEGWFEFKTFIRGWEPDISSDAVCTGPAGGSPPYASTHHMGLCGHINIFSYNETTCTIDNF